MPRASAVLVLPTCNTEAMPLNLDETATKITPYSFLRSSWMA
jgi:hypothetical protein